MPILPDQFTLNPELRFYKHVLDKMMKKHQDIKTSVQDVQRMR